MPKEENQQAYISLDELQQAAQKERKKITDTTKNSQIQLVSFELGETTYALPISAAKEVLPCPPMAKIPKAAAHIQGVVNVRGEILAAINLFNLLDQKIGAEEKVGFFLVLQQKNKKQGLLIPKLPETLKVNEQALQAAEGLFQNNPYIKALFQSPKGIAVLLDIDKI
ncbi:chemotaxis signal transduction protein [Saprospira grandis DSM 2844]|uniref:Chemotaxis signal transduction protein n=1 Tax=Saprospira grandis DSM 2844 TaxID=694433 RepID=J0NXI9_9BACT|nr:chemotaxis protein CheW [Saprospira grandis]EJF52214.1 chemotaxis signal transduction protein [Saprospira grandis DSM 2844]